MYEITKVCQHCGNDFTKPKTRSIRSWAEAKFCSRRCSDEAKRGISTWNKGLSKETDPRVAEYGKKDAISRKGGIPWNKGLTIGTDLRVASYALSRKGSHNSKSHLEAVGRAQKALWQNPKYVFKQMRARGVKPNKSEQHLISLITEAGLPYRYVGDGQFILGGKCPDFLNVDGKKQIIELFGTYWHDIFDVAKRTEDFRQYGFQTLVVWEDELKDTAKVLSKITKFSKVRR